MILKVIGVIVFFAVMVIIALVFASACEVAEGGMPYISQKDYEQHKKKKEAKQK